MRQIKKIPILKRKLGVSRKFYLVSLIIKHSKISNEMFGTKVLTFEELSKMNVDQLVNLHIELRIRIGAKRTPYQYQQT